MATENGESLPLLDQKEQDGRAFTELKDYYCRKAMLDHTLSVGAETATTQQEENQSFNNLDPLLLPNLLDLIRG